VGPGPRPLLTRPVSGYDRLVSVLPSFRPKAVIFDLDGTLVNNMPWHVQAFDAFVERHGLPPMDMAMRERTDGKRNREIFPILFGRDLTPIEIERLEEEKEGMYREVSRGRLRPMNGLVVLLDRLDAHGIPSGVATSGPRKNVEHTLGELGLADRFRAIARGDQVEQGKPAPDVFLHAARLLGADPLDCLAFEDAPLGVAAARNAGMHCVALTSTYGAKLLFAAEPGPHATFEDFQAFLDGAGKWLKGSPVPQAPTVA
jgi:beta-phosphoglucomutase